MLIYLLTYNSENVICDFYYVQLLLVQINIDKFHLYVIY